MTYNGKSHKENSKFGEDQFLAAITKLNEREISSLRLNAENVVEASNPIYSLGLKILMELTMVLSILSMRIKFMALT